MQNTHSCDVWVQLQITKCCIINISAQLLLSKHRPSKKPTGTSQGYLQSKDIGRILIIYSFEIYLLAQNSKRYKSFVSEQQRKGRKNCKIHPSFDKEREQNSRKFTKIQQNTGQQAQSKVTYPNFAPLDSSPRIENCLTFEPFAPFFLFLVALCHELNR